MRVTKTIRNYIEKEVAKAIPFGKPTTEYIEADKALNELCSKLNNQAKQYIKELLATVGELPEGFIIKPNYYSSFCCDSYHSPMYGKRTTHEREIHKKRAEATENIVVSLELGGTKEELASIIQSAIAEVMKD